MTHWSRSVPSWISMLLACMGGCLGCCSEAPLVISVDAPSKGVKIKGERVKKKHSVTEDFWNPTSGDMDNSAFLSHRSISSISTSNQTHDTQSSGDGTTKPSECINHGLLLWNQTRQQWVGIKGSQKSEQAREPKLSWNATYENLLGTNKPFAQPIPLSEMVESFWLTSGSRRDFTIDL